MIGSSSRAAILVTSAALFFGCAGSNPGGARDPSSGRGGAPVRPVAVSDDDFATRTYQLLLDSEPTPERDNLLVGVVRRQIARAENRFATDNEVVGLRALLGAFFLVRVGEFHPELLEGSSRALSAGAAEVSRLGQEGHALALYSMLQTQLPRGPERAEVDAHIKAIEDFARSTHGNGPLETASNEARVALQRALLEATPEALERAREALARWIRGAIAVSGDEQAQANFEREEAIESYRALRGGTIAMIALYLRHGDPRGALNAIAKSDLERLLPPELAEQLENAADDDDPEAFSQLYRLFESAAQDPGSLALVDNETMAAAAFGSSLELYRALPGSLQGALPLATQLVRYGMAEVASPVLAAAVNVNSPPEHLSVCLAMVLNSLVAEDAAGQLDAARRTFSGAAPLFELGERRSMANRLQPSVSRVRYVMGALEARHGAADRALPLLEKSIATEPTTEALNLVASIERHRNRPDAALKALDRVIAHARTTNDGIAHTDALLHKFETLRDAGRAALAAQTLEAALAQAVEAQRQGRPGPSQARIERLLARALELYRNQPGVRRATERAYEAANGDVRQLSATVLDASRRALTLGDLPGARAAAQRAIEAKLESDEIVYVALWLQLLERWLKVPSDGTTEEAYATIDESSGWPAKLKAWARGRLSDAELTSAARDTAERTEAQFYTVLGAQGPNTPAAKGALRDVARSGAVDLIEVTIARDLLAQPGNYVLPPKIAVP